MQATREHARTSGKVIDQAPGRPAKAAGGEAVADGALEMLLSSRFFRVAGAVGHGEVSSDGLAPRVADSASGGRRPLAVLGRNVEFFAGRVDCHADESLIVRVMPYGSVQLGNSISAGLSPRLTDERMRQLDPMLPDLWAAIAEAIECFTPEECRNYFAAVGHDAF